MTLIVETGAGLVDADAFISVTFADDYHAANGNTTWTGDDAVKEVAIRRATAFMSAGYDWAGLRTKGRAQSLAWPRSGVVDDEGYGILSTEIPPELKQAVAEIALRELVDPGSMTPDFKASEQVKREKIGSLEVEYLNASMSASSIKPVVSIVNDLIGQFLCRNGGSAISGNSFRV